MTFTIDDDGANPEILESAIIDNQNGFLTVLASDTLGSTTIKIKATDDTSPTPNVAYATFTVTVNDNLVQNGSFEQIVTPNPWNYIHAIPEWTLESGPNFELQKNLLQTSAEGSQYLELDAHPLPGSTAVSQTVDTVAGVTYELRFAFSGRPGTSTAHNHLGLDLLDVDAAGVETALDFTLLDEATGAAVTNNEPNLPGNSGWVYYTTTFLATGPSTKLQFADLGPSDTYGGFVDDVSVVRQAPVVSISVDTTEIAETGGTATFTVERDVATLDSLDVDLFLSGDALLDVDYTFTGVTFTDDFATIEIPAGQSSASFTLTGQDDFEAELDEIAAVDILFGTPDYLAPLADEDAFAEVTITDDEQGVSISVDRDFIDEDPDEDTTATFTVSRTGPNDADLDVYLSFAGDATLGTDYTLGSDVMFDALLGKYFVTIHANQSDPLTTTFTITTVNDSDLETTEFIQVDIDYGVSGVPYTTPAAGLTYAEAGINDKQNPKPVISIEDVDSNRKRSPGAIIFRNSDFSKQVAEEEELQTEQGITRYKPDYGAASFIPEDPLDPSDALEFLNDPIDSNFENDFVKGTVELDGNLRDTHKFEFKYDNTKIRLWTQTNWGGELKESTTNDEFDPVKWYVIRKDEVLEARDDGSGGFLDDDTIEFWIEGIANSDKFSDDSLRVDAIATAGGVNTTDSIHYTVVETGLGVDGNRDGTIDIANSFDRQLNFWYNHDRETTVGNYETDLYQTPSQPNSDFGRDKRITHRRDLEDFASLGVFVNDVLAKSTVKRDSPEELKILHTLKLLDHDTSTGLQLFTSRAENDEALDHVSDTLAARTHVSLRHAELGANKEAGFSGKSAFLNEANKGGYTQYIFESTGNDVDTFQVELTTNVSLASAENLVISSKKHIVDMTLQDFEDFYSRYAIDYIDENNNDDDLRNNLDFTHYEDAVELHDSKVKNAPFLSGNDNIVLVHGWNEDDKTSNDTKRELAETTFKRLYWQGFRGDLYEFDWPTYVDANGPTKLDKLVNTDVLEDLASVVSLEGFVGVAEDLVSLLNFTYNASELQAFRSGQALKNFLELFQDENPLNPEGDVHLLAHSQGNVVVAEALRQWSVENPSPDPEEHLVENYVSMEGAISAGLYGDNEKDALATGVESKSDLYRRWATGHPDYGAGASYMEGTEAAAGTWFNMYNPQDAATSVAWRLNNAAKPLVTSNKSPVWSYDYTLDISSAPPIVYTRTDEATGVDTNLDKLTDASGKPGEHAYEIISFISVANTMPIGTKEVDEFDVNKNIQDLGIKGDAADKDSPYYVGAAQNHSFQFQHDAAVTSDFWKYIKEQTGFEKTY